MANKQISQLPAALQMNDGDLLVCEQNGVAKRLTGSILMAMINSHGGITGTSYTPPVSPSLQGTLTLTFTDGTSFNVPIMNGAQGAQGIQGEQGEQGAAFTYADFTPEQLESLRGEQGIQGVPGNPGYVHIKWSSVEPTSDADMGDIPDAWMGIYSGSSSTAPTAYTAYAWYKIKGETGARGFTGARGANGTKIYLSNAAPIFYGNYYYFDLSQLVSPDGQIGFSPDSGDLILYRNSYYSSTGITDSLRGVRCNWGYDIVLSTATDEQVQDAVDEYLTNHPTVTGTFTNEAKNALLTLLEKVAYTVSNGQTYLAALRTELFRINVDSISAVFTQGSAVIYDTDSLDTLKQYLVVTATYSDSSTEVLADSVYTLSGTLSEGTSTITVSYGGKTDTFDVTVTLDRVGRFGAFTDGFTAVKITTSPQYPSYVPCCYRQAAANRATHSVPIENKNYIFTVTDTSKYNIVVYDVTSLNELQIPSIGSANPKVAYSAGTKTIAWAASDSASTPYIWVALKKMDNTPFTEAELANAAEAVFTFTTT